jgi:hypothetical protein
MSKWKRFRENLVLFKQRVTTRDYIPILRDRENYRPYLTRAREELVALQRPILIEFNIEGLAQCQAIIKQSLENVHVVEQLPYENPELEELILQQQNNLILNLNNQGLTDSDTIIIAKALTANRVRK